MALLQQLREQWSLSKPVTAGIALALAFLLAVGVMSHMEFTNLRLLTEESERADEGAHLGRVIARNTNLAIMFASLLAFTALVGATLLVNRNITARRLAEVLRERAWAELEQRVEERTAELASANASLRAEMAERERAEEALHKEREFLRVLLETVEDGIVTCDASGTLTFFNHATRQIHAEGASPLPPEEWASRYRLYHPDGETLLQRDEVPLYRALHGEAVHNVEVVIRPPQGPPHTVLVSGHRLFDSRSQPLGAVAVMHDITERKKLEEQFRQAQKMEAVGHLAGGIAHDFNNLLTVILGYSETLLTELSHDRHLRDMVLEVYQVGERAAMLTRQLLAFSRKQVLAPQVVDLNGIVMDLEKMLRRLIGEDIELHVAPAADLGRVFADPGQLEQVLLNLVVNARDAMPRGGQLTIETRNVELDAAYAQDHLAVQPGSYVLLAVSDTGCGMDEATRARLFEPFFTTKEPGKGTGLGLATVYGIVKQSGGDIFVYSEVGRGTTFKIYLPRVQQPLAPPGPKGLGRMPRGDETVLLVEDEDSVRGLSRHVLLLSGYRVLEARNGDEALGISGDYAGAIDLLLTDVVMPNMGGRELADHMSRQRPTLKVLYLSGYTEDAVVRHGVLAADTAFLQKPFTPAALAQKVRDVLDDRH
jgi:two-component system cell cycle sensor histidine kinase/response regulator CckA